MPGETWLQSWAIGRESLGTAAVQTITTSGVPTGGTFTLSFNGQTTTALQYNDTFTNIQAALRALPNIGGTLVTCAGGPLPAAVTVTFSGTLLGPQPLLTHTDSLTGGTAPAVVVANTRPGVSAVGTAVPATRKMYYAVGDKLTRVRKPVPHVFMVGRRDNVLAETAGPVSAAGTCSQPLSSSEVIEPLLAGLRGGVLPTSLAAGTVAVQTLNSTATGGSFTLTFGSQTTGSLGPIVPATSPTAATIGTALNALSTITAAGGVVVSGGPMNTAVVITFNTPGPQALISANNVSTTGGTVTVANTTPGVASVNLWTFTPGTALDSQTWQWFDGARAWNALGVRIADFKISGAVEQPTTFAMTLAGTNLLPGPITGGLIDRTPDFIEGWETALYLDAFGTAPGQTKISGTLLSWEVSVNNTVDYKYTADNTLAANSILLGALVCTAKLKLEAAPQAALTEFQNWDNSGSATPIKRMIRLSFGNNTLIQGAFNTFVTVDVPAAATMVDLGQIDGATRCYELSYQYVYDPTNLYGLQIRCQNTKTAAY